MRRSYQRNDDQREGDETQDALESYVREGAQQMLAAVLEEEVNAFLAGHAAVSWLPGSMVLEPLQNCSTGPT